MTRNPPLTETEPPCERCRVFTLECFLERSRVDDALCCPGCLAEDPPEDEDDERDDYESCACRGHCNACTPGVERWI